MNKERLTDQLEALFSDSAISESESEPTPEELWPQESPKEPPKVEAMVAEAPALAVKPAVESPWEVTAIPEGRPPAAEPEIGVKVKDVSRRVLIVQSDSKSAQALANFFTVRGDQVWQATHFEEAHFLWEQNEPELVVVDLHLPGGGWQEVLQHVQRRFPDTKVLLTASYPDLKQELLAREHGTRVFLRQPFTRAKVEQALYALEEDTNATPEGAAFQASLPKVRVPVRVKITFPYVLLALLLAMAGAYVVTRVVLDTIEERFTNQLIEAGKLTADWMVQEENRLLESLRLLSNIQGMPDAVVAGDAEHLRELALPIAVNYQEEAVEILDTQGKSLLSLRHRSGGNIEDYSFSQGDDIFAQWEFVQSVLERRVDLGGDKYPGLVQAPWGDYFYVAGPIVDDYGNQVGVILVGKSVSTLVRQIRENTLAHATVYELSGQPTVSTFLLEEDAYPLTPEQALDVLGRQDHDSLIRDLTVGSINYSEVVGPWEARGGNDLGLVGTALAQTFLVRSTQFTRLQVFLLVTLGFLLVIVVGVYLARRITYPLLQVVRASAEVAQGNLEVQVEPVGNDEVAVLAHSFNYMVSGLREGSIYRDLLGRTVSPEVREQLRQSFASGNLRLEGQSAVATVLMSDIKGFSALSEEADPTTILAWLNEYFGELVPIVTSNHGVVHEFIGDAVLAFFGVLPRPLTPQESAYHACQAAVEMIKAIERINIRRIGRGDPPFMTGIGINTGPVTAGGLGAADRVRYTIIGDTVNTTERLESFTREFGESSVVISQSTFSALREWRHEFNLEPLGGHTFKGKSEPLLIYRLWPSEVGVKETVR